MEILKFVNDIYLNAEVIGYGEPVLCLSGFGCSNYNYELIKDELAVSFKCVLLDNCGTGKSDSRRGLCSIEQLADDAVKFMFELGYRKFHVIGISMGGFISQAIARYYQESVYSLSLLCTTSAGINFKALPDISDEKLKSFYSLPIEESSYIGVKSTVSPGLELRNPKLFSFIVKLRQVNPVSIATIIQQKTAVDNFLRGTIDLGLIKCSTLILSGDKDRYVSPENSLILKRQIKNSRVVFVENSDHLFFLEQSKMVVCELKYFIKNQIYRIGEHV